MFDGRGKGKAETRPQSAIYIVGGGAYLYDPDFPTSWEMVKRFAGKTVRNIGLLAGAGSTPGGGFLIVKMKATVDATSFDNGGSPIR